MATVLEMYQSKKKDYQSQIEEDSFPMQDLVLLQELNYRISVLETFQSLCRTAPLTMDMNVISWHYQMVVTVFNMIQKERQFGSKTDDAGQKKRDTAMDSLTSVIESGKKRFKNFAAPTQETYRKCIGDYCNAVLPMWMQYRNTLISL